VESIDDGVGRIIERLREEGLLERTLIIFTSDNGGLGLDELGPTPTSVLPLRKWKGHVYEGGIRVPAIVSWEGKVPSGFISDTYFSSIDYFPTLCELAGIKKLPENVDGKSVLSLFLQPESQKPEERPVYWHYPHFSNQLGRPAGAVRVGDYKLVESYETGELELYDLENDISESKNLSLTMKQKTQELYKLLVQWRKSLNANMPVKNPLYKTNKSINTEIHREGTE